MTNYPFTECLNPTPILRSFFETLILFLEFKCNGVKIEQHRIQLQVIGLSDDFRCAF
ncbi:MAG: hypothetical protein K6F06_01740 [Bacteroidales bacterium]|nr:hypothetical protein [Bacteroidales bacterium]